MALVWRCLLDTENALTGYEQVDDTVLQPNDVWFVDKPDLPVDVPRYRWNGERFDPIRLGDKWSTPGAADAWYAVFRALGYLQKNTAADFPAPVKQWLRYYYLSFARDTDEDPTA